MFIVSIDIGMIREAAPDNGGCLAIFSEVGGQGPGFMA